MARKYYAFVVDGKHVRHGECGGVLYYYQCDAGVLTTVCGTCRELEQDRQLNLFDWKPDGPNP